MSFLDDEEIILINGKDYIISEKINIFEILKDKNEQIIILTLFKDKCNEISKQFKNNIVLFSDNLNSKITPDVIITTPLFFLQNIKSYCLKTKFIVVNEPHLISDFQYSDILTEIKNEHGFSYIAVSKDLQKYKFLKNPLTISCNQNFHIQCSNNEIFYFLYSVLKYKLFDGSIGILANDLKEKRKIEIFLKVLNRDEQVNVISNECISDISTDGSEKNNKLSDSKILSYNNFIILVPDFSVEKITFDRAIYLGEKPSILNIKTSNFDFSRIEKYKYRINDFLNSLTRGVLKGKKEFDYNRFSSMRLQ